MIRSKGPSTIFRFCFGFPRVFFSSSSLIERVVQKHNLSQANIIIFEQLERDARKVKEAHNTLSQPDIPHQINKEMRDIVNQLSFKAHLFDKLQVCCKQIDDYDTYEAELRASGDHEDAETIKEEKTALLEQLFQLEEEAKSTILPVGKYDHISTAKLEFRPGTGGAESSLFAEEILGMYDSYASLLGWSTRVISFTKDTQIGKGCKHALLEVIGENAYSHLQCESGVHKVIRVPATEAKGRLHSSTMSVIVLPEIPMVFLL